MTRLKHCQQNTAPNTPFRQQWASRALHILAHLPERIRAVMGQCRACPERVIMERGPGR
jgi:hypothetical protein